MTNRVAKLFDCRNKDVGQRELFIVEGDSALGSCKQARDPDFQAIIPLHGKILNCLKCEYDKIFKKRDYYGPHKNPRLRRRGEKQGEQGAFLPSI